MLATGNNEAPAAATIQNNGFWPNVEPSDFRAAERVDSTITPRRATEALLVAMMDINRQLAEYQSAQLSAGRASVDEIPVEAWQMPGSAAALYVRAVYAQATADLYERYQDYSATDAGDERGEAKASAADSYRGDARWAIAELTGATHTTVELI